MTCFVDSSAFLAMLDDDDTNHRPAAAIWTQLLAADESLITSSYVIVEVTAVLQRRVGMDSVRAFHEDYVPLVSIQWVEETIHASALSALLAANRRQLSLVDCVSFEVMRRRGIIEAFVFDQHFVERGITCLSVPRL